MEPIAWILKAVDYVIKLVDPLAKVREERRLLQVEREENDKKVKIIERKRATERARVVTQLENKYGVEIAKDLSKYYIWPYLSDTPPGSKKRSAFRERADRFVDSFLVESLDFEGRALVLILAEAGMGKSSFVVSCVMRFIDNDELSGRIYDYTCKRTEIDRLESDLPGISKSKDLIVIDSLDESDMSRDLNFVLGEIFRLTAGYKVVVTSRQSMHASISDLRKTAFPNKLRLLYIQPMSDNDIRVYLKSRFNEERNLSISKDVVKIIRKVDAYFTARPLILREICNIVEVEPSRIEALSESRNLFDIYTRIVYFWILREIEKFNNGDLDIPARTFTHLLEFCINVPGGKRPVYDLSVRNVIDPDKRSLVRYSNGSHVFVHNSFFEYFLALHIRFRGSALGLHRLSDLTVDFLCNFEKHHMFSELSQYGIDGVISRTDFSGRHIFGLVMDGVQFVDCSFNATEFEACSIISAVLTGEINVVFARCSVDRLGLNARGSGSTNVAFRECDFKSDRITIAGADAGSRVSFEECMLGKKGVFSFDIAVPSHSDIDHLCLRSQRFIFKERRN